MARRKKARVKYRKGQRYRSHFEADLSDAMKGCKYEPEQFTYFVEREYTPDWVNKQGNVWFEAKAYFRTHDDARRYRFIAEQLAEKGIQLVFVFKDPNKPMPGARKRKRCGTKYSVTEWADNQGIAWCTPDTVKQYL